jgi:hypothetical protein
MIFRIQDELRLITEEEALITHVSNGNVFCWRTWRREVVLNIKTTNNWSIEVIYDQHGVQFVRKAVGPDGKNHVGWASIPIHNLLDDAEIAALNTEMKSALGSLFPL